MSVTLVLHPAHQTVSPQICVTTGETALHLNSVHTLRHGFQSNLLFITPKTKSDWAITFKPQQTNEAAHANSRATASA